MNATMTPHEAVRACTKKVHDHEKVHGTTRHAAITAVARELGINRGQVVWAVCVGEGNRGGDCPR